MHLCLNTPIQSCRAAIANKSIKKNRIKKADKISFIDDSKVTTNALTPGIEERLRNGLSIRIDLKAFKEKPNIAKAVSQAETRIKKFSQFHQFLK